MAKERADKVRKDKSEKAEKHTRDGKVKKSSKKEKKIKVETPEESSDDDTSVPGGAKLDEDPMDIDSPDETPKKKPKKADVKAEEQQVNALFAIDTKPTPINTVKQEAPDSDSSSDSGNVAENEAEESKVPKHKTNVIAPPTGLNRQERRRLAQIGQHREVLRKKLDVPLGTTDKAKEAELEAELAKWVEELDAKAAIRMEKKAKRKEKEAQKLKNKRGKVLTGRRLKEREKQIRKVEKKSSKAGGRRASS